MKLYYNATIITMDEQRRMIFDGALAVSGQLIKAVGKTADLEKQYPDAQKYDCRGDIILPGLINTHFHTAQTLARGMSDDVELFEWLTKRTWPVQCQQTKEEYKAAAMLSVTEMLLGGTTTFLEPMMVGMYGIEGLMSSIQTSGIRGCVGRVVMEPLNGSILPKQLVEQRKESWEAAIGAFEEWNHEAEDRIRVWLAPRWTSYFNESLFDDVAACMDKRSMRMTVHYAETAEDVAAIYNATGKSPAEFLISKGLARPETVLVHCTALPKGDEVLLAKHGVNVSYCPIGNMKITLGTCRAYDLRREGVNVVLGTDAVPCDNNCDMVLSMRMGALLQKHMTGNAKAFSAEDMLEMATIDAARALGLEDEIGSIQDGKRADFILIDSHKPRMCPSPNPASTVVYAATGSDVKMVVVNGKTVVENGVLLTMDQNSVVNRAEDAAAAIRERLEFSKQQLSPWNMC